MIFLRLFASIAICVFLFLCWYVLGKIEYGFYLEPTKNRFLRTVRRISLLSAFLAITGFESYIGLVLVSSIY